MDPNLSFRSRNDLISFQIQKRTIPVLLALIGFGVLVLIGGLSVGSTMIHPIDVIKHLFGLGSGEHAFTIDTLRLPRMLLSLLVGAALGVSGLILQSIIRNPLASPDVIGVTGGASAAAVFFLSYMASERASSSWLPLAALAGAGLVSLIIYLLAWKKGVTPMRIVLVGIGMAAAMGALTTFMIVLGPIATTMKAYIWLTGSVYGASWEKVYAMLPWLLVFAPLALFFTRAVHVQELGDQVAFGLGARVQLQRCGLLFIGVALAGSAVAYAGGVGFIGLIAPHIARKLIGRSFAGLVPISAVIGGLIMALADIVARTAFLPLDIPAGVFTAGIGAPFFIYLLYKNRYK
ncbi:iron ABC transporter permease [Brevibacillus humidisoli]|uniref:FecCD family ABC transporter permease n=1 Tax=Brevibacillus humidisoli TaxID=2895522 RepID=UPI001E3DEE8B|nr:iron ABC transporter permease [Brevibacillus humidisoli]UFJ39447.1 iron ABC transporter permease [Brevibacillus humidisoli]